MTLALERDFTHARQPGSESGHQYVKDPARPLDGDWSNQYRAPKTSQRGGNGGGNVRAKLLVVSVAAALVFPLGAPGAHAGSATWLTCKGLSGRMALTPGLPQLGHVDRVAPVVAIKNAKLTGCSGRAKRGTASATLKFAKATNCTTLIRQISSNVAASAAGTMTIGWTAGHASTIALKVRFGAVSNSPSLAIVSGSVTAGQFKGAKPSGNIEWSIGPSECFGGQPLTTFDFSLYTLAVSG